MSGSHTARFPSFLVHHRRRFAWFMYSFLRRYLTMCSSYFDGFPTRPQFSRMGEQRKWSTLARKYRLCKLVYFLHPYTIILKTMNRHTNILWIKIDPPGHGNLTVSRSLDDLLKFTCAKFLYSSSCSWKVVSVSRDNSMWCYTCKCTITTLDLKGLCFLWFFTAECKGSVLPTILGLWASTLLFFNLERSNTVC